MWLIDAEALLEKMEKVTALNPKAFGTMLEYMRLLALDCVKGAPTIEAKPVEHAHWISKNILITPYTEDDYEEEIYSCSNCTLTIECETPYCPYCGAQMDEIVEGSTGIVKGSTKIVEGGKE